MQNMRSSHHLFCVVLALTTLLMDSTAPAQLEEIGGFRFLEITVLDPDGKPLLDANVEVSIDGMEFPLMTDEEGIVSFNVPSQLESSLTLTVREDGYAALGARWGKSDKLPTKFTIPVAKGTTIGGIVHDEDGNPIEGVEIQAVTSSRNDKPGELRPWLNGVIGTTDSEGRWRNESAPENELQIQLRLQHTDYIEDTANGRHRATWDQLLSLDHVLVLKKGIEIRGKVSDPEGQPIAGAKVSVGSSQFGGTSQVVDSNENGEYALKNVPAGNGVLTVYAEHWAPDLRMVTAEHDMEPIDLELEPGHSIRVRVTDPDGQPIPSVWIAPDSWRGHRTVSGGGGVMPRFMTDSSGIWESDSMPADEIEFAIFKQGHVSVRNQKLIAQADEHVIVMPNPLVVQGKVVDSETGKAIEKFNIVQGIRWNESNQNLHWERYNVQSGQGGEYRTTFSEPRFGHLVRIEAEGYRPGVSRMIKTDEGEVTIDFELEAGSGPSGLVKTPTGEPAAGTAVLMAVSNQHLQISNGKQIQNSGAGNVLADAEGRFTLPFPESEFLVIFLHESGWSEIEGQAFEDSNEITLTPWSRVEGKLVQGKEPLPDGQIQLSIPMQHRPNQPNVYWSHVAQTNGDGSFSFDRVRAGAFTVGKTINYGDAQRFQMGATTHTQQVTLEPGKTAQIQIGGTGRTLKGHLTVPDEYEGQVAWNMGLVLFHEQLSGPRWNNPLVALGKALAQFGQEPDPAAKPPVQKFFRSYAAAIAEDGTFEIRDVLPGQYQMVVQLQEPYSGDNYQWKQIGLLHQSVTVPESKSETTDEPIDLGEQELTMVQQ